jgi:hypothetical protein
VRVGPGRQQRRDVDHITTNLLDHIGDDAGGGQRLDLVIPGWGGWLAGCQQHRKQENQRV